MTACNYSRFKNAEYDKLIDRGRPDRRSDKRNALLRKADAILYEEAPVWFFNYNKAVMAYQPWIHGLQAERDRADAPVSGVHLGRRRNRRGKAARALTAPPCAASGDPAAPLAARSSTVASPRGRAGWSSSCSASSRDRSRPSMSDDGRGADGRRRSSSACSKELGLDDPASCALRNYVAKLASARPRHLVPHPPAGDRNCSPSGCGRRCSWSLAAMVIRDR